MWFSSLRASEASRAPGFLLATVYQCVHWCGVTVRVRPWVRSSVAFATSSSILVWSSTTPFYSAPKRSQAVLEACCNPSQPNPIQLVRRWKEGRREGGSKVESCRGVRSWAWAAAARSSPCPAPARAATTTALPGRMRRLRRRRLSTRCPRGGLFCRSASAAAATRRRMRRSTCWAAWICSWPVPAAATAAAAATATTSARTSGWWRTGSLRSAPGPGRG